MILYNYIIIGHGNNWNTYIQLLLKLVKNREGLNVSTLFAKFLKVSKILVSQQG